MTDVEKEEVRLELLACTFADEAAVPGWRAVQPEEGIAAGRWERESKTVPPGSQFRSAAVSLALPGVWRLSMPNVDYRKPTHFVEGPSPRALMRIGSEKMTDRRWLLAYASLPPELSRTQLYCLHSVYQVTDFCACDKGTLSVDYCEPCKNALQVYAVTLPELAMQRLDWLVHFEAICGLSRMFIDVRDGAPDADLWTWSYTAETGWGEAVCVPADALDPAADPTLGSAPDPSPNTTDPEITP